MAIKTKYKIDELRKMSEQDRSKMIRDLEKHGAHELLRNRSNESKKSDTPKKIKKLIARLHTLNNEAKQSSQPLTETNEK